MVRLIGPGGAGKTTTGALLAQRLGADFIDLDGEFGRRVGDISDCIRAKGYVGYARENVETYISLMHERSAPLVVALSSGFMTYPIDVHPAYDDVRSTIAEHPTTFVLIPSLDIERCVAETVRRQSKRPFARSAAAETSVIRQRFQLYVNLPARKIETDRAIEDVVSELVAVRPEL